MKPTFKGELPRPINITPDSQKRLAIMLGLKEDAKLGAIANAARQNWSDLYPQFSKSLSVIPEGSDIAVLDFILHADPDKEDSGETPPEILELRKELESI